MTEAYGAFRKNTESIESLIRGADIYCQHLLAISRSKEPDRALIEKIITQKQLSTLAWSWRFYMTPKEHDEFDKAGHLRRMCEHIVFASYVALESYLISKFREYFGNVFSALGDERCSALLEHLSFRNLQEIERRYSALLNIRIAAFEPDVGVLDEVEWFQPKSTWDGLRILEKVRNELAHSGEVHSHNIIVLVDAWSPFDFVCEWVELFESNFNDFFFEGRITRSVRDCMKADPPVRRTRAKRPVHR